MSQLNIIFRNSQLWLPNSESMTTSARLGIRILMKLLWHSFY